MRGGGLLLLVRTLIALIALIPPSRALRLRRILQLRQVHPRFLLGGDEALRLR